MRIVNDMWLDGADIMWLIGRVGLRGVRSHGRVALESGCNLDGILVGPRFDLDGTYMR